MTIQISFGNIFIESNNKFIFSIASPWKSNTFNPNSYSSEVNNMSIPSCITLSLWISKLNSSNKFINLLLPIVFWPKKYTIGLSIDS